MREQYRWWSVFIALCLSTNISLAEDLNQTPELLKFDGGTERLPVPPSILPAPPAPHLTFPIPAPSTLKFAPLSPEFTEQTTFKLDPVNQTQQPPIEPASPASKWPSPQHPAASLETKQLFQAPSPLPQQVPMLAPSQSTPGFNYDIFLKSIEAEMEKKRGATNSSLPPPTMAPVTPLPLPTGISRQLTEQLRSLVELQTIMQKNLQQSQRHSHDLNLKYQALVQQRTKDASDYQQSSLLLRQEVAGLANELETLKTQLSTEKQTNTQLTDQIHGEKLSLEKVLGEQHNLNQHLSDAKIERDTLLEKLQQATEQENILKPKLEQTLLELKEKQEQLSLISTSADKAAQVKIIELQSTLASLENKDKNRKSELADSLRELATSSMLVSSLQMELTQAKATPDRSNEISTLQQGAAQLEEHLAQHTTKIETLMAEKTSLETQLNDSIEIVKALETDVGKKQNELEEHSTKIEFLHNELDTTKKSLSEASLQIDSLNKKLSDTESAKFALELMTQDSDGDGVTDDKDRCIDTPSKQQVDATGCMADSDKDLVTDTRDLCPLTPKGKKVDSLGCNIKEAITLQGLTFKTGSAHFSDDSLLALNNLVSVLAEFPELVLEIAGHTDNIGVRERNITLSNRRAIAVKNHLIENGIDKNRLSAKGYGPDEPISDNTTPEGREQNRRVELRRE